jgi:hypothetical protein
MAIAARAQASCLDRVLENHLNISDIRHWLIENCLVDLGLATGYWDVTHERALSPADLIGGKAPVGALIGLLERIC